MGKVLITASHYGTLCAEAKSLLEKNGHEVILNKSDMPYYSFEELKSLVRDIDAAIIGMDNWNEDVFNIAPRLKVIARFGVGVDNIDLAAAKRHGIKVTNARGQNSNAVAELAVAYMLSMLRAIPQLDSSLKEGNWKRFVGYDIMGKTIGLIGFGDIARKVAKKISGFGVRILACDVYPNFEVAKELGVSIVDEDTLLRESNIVSIHIPSSKETFHYMDKERFEKMRMGSFFVNTARGALVDTEALCDAVESGHIAAAAIDVYEQEPLEKNARITKFPNIITTPHTGAETYGTYSAISLTTAKAVIDVLSGKDPENWLNR